MSLIAQEVLLERYEIVRLIKSGGMGAVYEAIDRKLANTPCAIKEVLASALQGPDALYVLQSFDSEVRSLATLEHPNIPRVRDYFEIEQRRYIVMDLVQGKPLDEELKEQVRLTGQPMDPSVVAMDMVTVLETLHYLHSQQPPIVHRDIKPANLIREQRTGKVKLVDFGIARSIGSQSVQTQVGTPGYCAPEQMAGLAESRSDVYSVGATLFRLCTGNSPRGYSFEPMVAHLPDHPGLVAIVKKATAFKPENRYASADEMAQALRRWLSNETSGPILVDQLPTPAGGLSVSSPPGSDRLLYATVGLLLLMLVGFLLWVVNHDPSRQSQLAIVTFSPALIVTPTPSHTPPSNKLIPVAIKKPPQPTPKVRPLRPSPQPTLVTPSLGSPDYPTASSQASSRGRLDGFRLRRPVPPGKGGEYVKDIDGRELTITAREFPNQSMDDLLKQWGLPIVDRSQPVKRPGADGGWSLYQASPTCYHEWHFSHQVTFEIQVVRYNPSISDQVNNFILAYLKRR